MSRFDRDDLPPDLSELDRLLRAGRAVPGEDTMRRMQPRTQSPGGAATSRAPRRTLAVGMATVGAMGALTGGAAAAMFGSVPLLEHSSHGTAQMTVKRSSATPGSKPATIALGKARAAAVTKASNAATPVPAAAGGSVIGAKALATPALRANAGNFQYRLRQLVCGLLRRAGLNFLANLLGCPR